MTLRSAPPGFNSTLVQLKDNSNTKTKSKNPSFNSTLVHLKGIRNGG